MLSGRLMSRQRNNWLGHAMTVGDEGEIYYSSNGKSWTDRAWYGGKQINYITGRSATNGSGTTLIACNDGKIFKTTDGGSTWSLLTTHPFNSSILGIQYVNGRWYVTQDGAFVKYSTDLVNWTSVLWSGGVPSIAEYDGIFTFSMAYDATNGVYAMYAADVNGPAYLFSSTDGTTFTRRHSVSGTTIYRGAVAFGNGHFVLCSNDGVIRESTDAVTWNTRSPAGGVSPDFHDVKYANGVFMACAFGTEGVQTSSDGVTWTQVTSPGDVVCLAFKSSSSTWVAVGRPSAGGIYQAWTSTDNGATWTSRAFATSSNSPVLDVVYDGSNGKFMAIAPNIDLGDFLHAQTSSDGATWTKTFVSGAGLKSNVNFNAVMNNGSGRWVAIGSYGAIIYSDDNGVTWTQAASGTSQTLYSIGYHDSMTPKWVIVGGDGVTLTSSDGSTWTLYTGSTAMDLVDVACNGTVWVAADVNGSVWTSANGSSWTERALSTSTFTPGWCTSVAWNGSVFCAAVMNGAFTDLESQTSADGITWTSRNDPTGGKTQKLYNMSYADGKFRAYSFSGGDLYTSSDGITWTEEYGSYSFNLDDAGFSDHAQCLAFSETGAGNKIFLLAAGQSFLTSSLLWSLDGVAVNFASGIPSGSYVRAVHAYTTV